MTSTRILELEMICAAHPVHKSSALILECLEEIKRLQARKAKRAAFTPPTVEEVAAYFREGDVFNGSSDARAEEFVDFYASKGWIVGKARMVDWKASARLWEARAKERAALGPAVNRQVAAPRL